MAPPKQALIGQLGMPTEKPELPEIGGMYYDRSLNSIFIWHGVPPFWQPIVIDIKICACGCPQHSHKLINKTMQIGPQPCNECTKCVDFAEDNLDWLMQRDAVSKGTVC